MSDLLRQQLLGSLAEGSVSPAGSDAGESGEASVIAHGREQQTGASPHHHSEVSMFDWNAKAPMLNAKLNPAHVKERKQAGRQLSYIESWWAIAEANRIFGHGGWTFYIDELVLLSKELVRIKQQDYQTKQWVEVDQWRVCYSCSATVRVGEVSRQDVGYGQGQSKPEDLGSALESAGKEAASDAMKRCLRTFGNPFGLALYDKTKANVGVDAPEKRPEPPHDPDTGEITTRPSDGAAIRDAWKDAINDRLPKDRDERLFWETAALQLRVEWTGYKALKWLDGSWAKYEPILQEMQVEAADLFDGLVAHHNSCRNSIEAAPKTPMLTKAIGEAIIDTLGLCEDEATLDTYIATLEPYQREHAKIIAATDARRRFIAEPMGHEFMRA